MVGGKKGENLKKKHMQHFPKLLIHICAKLTAYQPPHAHISYADFIQLSEKKTQLGSILFSTVLATSLDFWHSRQQTDTQMRHMFSQSGLTAFPLFHSVEYTNMQRHLLHR